MEQLSFAEKTHNSKIAKLKLAYDDRTAALHKTIAQNGQVSYTWRYTYYVEF